MSEPEKKETGEGTPPPAHPEHPHSHPFGVGVGTASGAATGAAIGAMAGPIGAAIGAVAGGIIGGLTGEAVAVSLDPSTEIEYWKKQYATRPYVDAGTFEDFEPAYRYGCETKLKHGAKSFEELEPHLAAGWEGARGESPLDWDHARHAVQDAWYRLHRLSSLEINEHGMRTPP